MKGISGQQDWAAMPPERRAQLRAHVALSSIAGVGSVTARQLLAELGDADAVLKATKARLLKVPGIGLATSDAILAAKDAGAYADGILTLCAKKGISIHLISDQGYPQKLIHIPDPPVVLYSIGQGPVEVPRSVAIVGTRKNTPYGKRCTELIIDGLAGMGIAVISGLAFGIDTIAHRHAIDRGILTHAVVATPVDKVYPAQNRELAIKIFRQGRILSEYPPSSKVDARNFPMRNRIVAGLTDATIVIEAAESGGALITARLAQDYNREVFAVPGPLGEAYSLGCNKLIRNNGAILFTDVDDFLQEMAWLPDGGDRTPHLATPALPAHLQGQDKSVADCLLAAKKPIHIDDLSLQSAIPLNQLSGILLKLEFEGLVKALPGKKFSLVAFG